MAPSSLFCKDITVSIMFLLFIFSSNSFVHLAIFKPNSYQIRNTTCKVETKILLHYQLRPPHELRLIRKVCTKNFFRLITSTKILLHYQLSLSDGKVYKQAIKVERLMKKVQRCECTLKFLYNCRDNVFPKFVR